MPRRLALVTGLVALLMAPATLMAEQELTSADWVRLRKGELIVESKRDDGGVSSAWMAGLIGRPPELVWRAICNPQLFEQYFTSIPRSLLLDDGLTARVAALGSVRPDVVEQLLRGAANADWRREPDGRWAASSYQRARLPWPLRERWVVVRVTSDDQTMSVDLEGSAPPCSACPGLPRSR